MFLIPFMAHVLAQGVYVLQDNSFKPIARLSSWEGRQDATKRAKVVRTTDLRSSIQRPHGTRFLVCYDARGYCERGSFAVGIDWYSST